MLICTDGKHLLRKRAKNSTDQTKLGQIIRDEVEILRIKDNHKPLGIAETTKEQ